MLKSLYFGEVVCKIMGSTNVKRVREFVFRKIFMGYNYEKWTLVRKMKKFFVYSP
jgi:hypothetical protein